MHLQLPCTPRANAFLHIRYGDLLRLNESDRVAAYIYTCLRMGRKHAALQKHHSTVTWSYFPVKLTNTQRFDEKLLTISPISVAWYNTYLEEQFDTLFYLRITELVYMKRIPKENAISIFMMKYDIDEDQISAETLKKRYFRYRKKNVEFSKDLLGNNVPDVNTTKNTQMVIARIPEHDYKKLHEATQQLGMSKSKIIRSLIIKNISNAQFKSTKEDRSQLSLTL